MIDLKEIDLTYVSGGDRWGYESPDGSLTAEAMQAMANSYGQGAAWLTITNSYGAVMYTDTNLTQLHSMLGKLGPGAPSTQWSANLGPYVYTQVSNADGSIDHQYCLQSGLTVTIGPIGAGATAATCTTYRQAPSKVGSAAMN
jgi:hypothetical protein